MEWEKNRKIPFQKETESQWRPVIRIWFLITALSYKLLQYIDLVSEWCMAREWLDNATNKPVLALLLLLLFVNRGKKQISHHFNSIN